MATQGSGNTLSSYFNSSKNALEEMVKLFRQGGGYGAGQNAIIDEQANQTQAKAASDAVASGMSSGSLATSTGARIASDTAKAKLGVEDTRTNMLAQAMQALSNMYTQYGGMSSQENTAKNQLRAGQQNQAWSQPNKGAGGGIDFGINSSSSGTGISNETGYESPQF
jgi:hypothetical protein